MKVLIFGTGGMYKKYKECFKRMQIIGFVDNDKNKWGNALDGILIIAPNQILKLDYDYIILVSTHYKQMRAQLLELGIDEKKILDKEHKEPFDNLTVTENYVFCDENNQHEVLLISHALDLTGAPIAFCELAYVLKRNGYNVTVYSEKNGNVSGQLLYELIKAKISVILFESFESLNMSESIKKFDCIWVNTVILSDIVSKLALTGKEIYWWLHESEDCYRNRAFKTEVLLLSNLHIFSVGWLAQQAFEKYTGVKVEKNLLYGLPDSKEVDEEEEAHAKLQCGIVATYCARKGQDVLISVVEEHPEWKDKIEFVFIGRDTEKINKKLHNIKCVGEIAPSEVSKIYGKLDAIICPSLNDPMPIVVSEAMQHKKICLVTTSVGQSRYIVDEMDGLVCTAGSKESLTEKIEWLLEHRGILKSIGEKSYKIYDCNFAYSIFERNILQIM